MSLLWQIFWRGGVFGAKKGLEIDVRRRVKKVSVCFTRVKRFTRNATHYFVVYCTFPNQFHLLTYI